jgi:hypothetical protein
MELNLEGLEIGQSGQSTSGLPTCRTRYERLLEKEGPPWQDTCLMQVIPLILQDYN